MMQPVVAFASRRKTTAFATSSGRGLPSGISPAFSLTPSGASTGPGATALTRSVSAKSAAYFFVSARSPRLVLSYAPRGSPPVENVHDGAPPGLPTSHQGRELARRIKIHRLKRCIVADEKRRVVDNRIRRIPVKETQTRGIKLCRAKRLRKVGYDVCA